MTRKTLTSTASRTPEDLLLIVSKKDSREENISRPESLSSKGIRSLAGYLCVVDTMSLYPPSAVHLIILLSAERGQNRVQQLNTQLNEQPEQSTPVPRRRTPLRYSGCGIDGHIVGRSGPRLAEAMTSSTRPACCLCSRPLLTYLSCGENTARSYPQLDGSLLELEVLSVSALT